jgi:excisionase family DNA binding protein
MAQTKHESPVAPPAFAYSVDRFAALLGVSKTTVRRETTAGRLHALHVRRRLVIPSDSGRDYLQRLSEEKRG